jgi:hypothetical protein
MDPIPNHAAWHADPTSFTAVWNRLYVAGRRPIDQEAQVPMSWAEFRRAALELFSAGCVHNAATRKRLEELLPEPAAGECGAKATSPRS